MTVLFRERARYLDWIVMAGLALTDESPWNSLQVPPSLDVPPMSPNFLLAGSRDVRQ